MARNLKFRAWFKPDFETKDGPLLFQQQVLKNEYGEDGLYFVHVGEDGNTDIRYRFQEIFEDLGPDRWIIQQFTGILDRRGVEIYEGDIVKSNLDHYLYLLHKDISVYDNGRIEWFAGGFFVTQSHIGATPLIEFVDSEDRAALEVIGNIF